MTRRTCRAAVLAAVLLAGRPAQAGDPDPDPWFGRDKLLHFLVAGGIAAAGYGISTTFLAARGDALLVGGGLAVAAGAGKELLDMTGYGDPSWKDFAWDVIGALAGLTVAWNLDLALRGVGDRHPAFVAPHTTPIAPRGLTVHF